MTLDHFDGREIIDDDAELMDHLRRHRKGAYGAFVLAHAETGSSLWVHTNEDLAYLHFFPGMGRDHAGYQATDMPHVATPDTAHFLGLEGDEASAIDMPPETLVSLSDAYRAAAEYLKQDALPASISWFEL
jgi:hypothetical protein